MSKVHPWDVMKNVQVNIILVKYLTHEISLPCTGLACDHLAFPDFTVYHSEWTSVVTVQLILRENFKI